MGRDALKFYSDRLSGLETRLKYLSKRIKNIAIIRLLCFVGGIVLIGYSTSWGWGPVIGSVIIFSGVFVFLVRYHFKLSARKKHLENLISINKKELLAIKGDTLEFESGNTFIDNSHSYASDLDIFGIGSVFQYINRAATFIGRKHLAEWFKNPFLKHSDILSHQEAIKELGNDPEWIQEVLAQGYEASKDFDNKADILDWIYDPPEFSHWRYKVFVTVVPLIALATITLIVLKIIPVSFELLYLIIPFSILGKDFKKINIKYQSLSKKSAVIYKYSQLLSAIEKKEFTSSFLKELQEKLHESKVSPSLSIKKLSKIMNAFDSRLNLLAGFLLNAMFLWDIIQVLRVESWQAKYKQDVEKWFDIVAEFDALISLSVFHFNNPEFCFPEIQEQEFIIKGEEVGHPLIPAQQRIDNPVNISSLRKFLIITGANMAGKSTYLRTVGVNLTLAMMGAPVCAKSLKFTPITLMTSIRTRDNLTKNESYFYAELKNLKAIIDKLQAGEEIFILLDEILKGTNSRGKQSGSIALMQNLVRFKASGLIATHDLQLGKLEKESPENFINACFEVELKDDQLVFDYLLKKGVAKQMNATFLMEKMGITV